MKSQRASLLVLLSIPMQVLRSEEIYLAKSLAFLFVSMNGEGEEKMILVVAVAVAVAVVVMVVVVMTIVKSMGWKKLMKKGGG
jgi:mannose/fructose/N-acetylgalactosamine-specific phosphotransferase system component IIC